MTPNKTKPHPKTTAVKPRITSAFGLSKAAPMSVDGELIISLKTVFHVCNSQILYPFVYRKRTPPIARATPATKNDTVSFLIIFLSALTVTLTDLFFAVGRDHVTGILGRFCFHIARDL